MYLTQGLHRAVQRFPNKVALRHLDGGNATSLSFAALWTQVGQRAAWLQQLESPATRRALLERHASLLP